MHEDPYLWLEDVTGSEALDWVRARNTESTDVLAGTTEFDTRKADLLSALDADDRIPYARRRGEYLYNFWQDAEHPRGLWRRTTLESYRTAEPDWTVLLDVDALGAREGESWVWGGASLLYPDYHLALITLSRGGSDAAVVREYDLRTLRFVADGFILDEAKSRVSWIDEDRIFVGTDVGLGSLTSSGYPRQIREWRRGTALADAPVVFEGQPDDVSVFGYHDPTEGYERDVVGRNPDFYTSEQFLRTTDGLVRIEVPDDADIDIEREWLLVRLRSEWTVGGATHPAGALLAARLDDFLAGSRALTTVFRPEPHTSLEGWAWTRNHLVLTTLSDVTSKLEVLTPAPGEWRREPVTGIPDIGSTSVMDSSPELDDEFLLNTHSFLTPATFCRSSAAEPGAELEALKRAPARFDATGLTETQFFATSDDGTRVPYFVVRDPSAPPGPTLLTGYGGYEISLLPSYSSIIGRGWLAEGGCYVVANIRGGGEYGPSWHHAAMRERRPRAYEDFAAVAKDLVARGITTASQLGVEGGSNGGLLTGVMLTRYPELFGAVVSMVPLLDLRRYHLLLAGASWMAEMGDPDDPADWSYLEEFSPYHNVHSGQNYPPVLFLTSTRDDRVHPGHARKMVARMLELGYPSDRVRYYENIEGGHGGAADNKQSAHKWALVFEFLRGELGG